MLPKDSNLQPFPWQKCCLLTFLPASDPYSKYHLVPLSSPDSKRKQHIGGWGSASLFGGRKGGGPALMGGGGHQEASMEQLQPVGDQSWGALREEGAEQASHAACLLGQSTGCTVTPPRLLPGVADSA